ncbi:MAG TPA: helix-turn-helix domain-containing protein [Sporichthya sp.]|nr:helix-turn-helix domain-containing protein [Sporichthya sp.]
MPAVTCFAERPHFRVSVSRSCRSRGQRPARVQRQFDRRHHVAETLRKGSRVTGSARERLAADLKKKYSQGRSIRSLAEETGRSYGFVHRMLTESGVTLRGRGGATRGKVKA